MNELMNVNYLNQVIYKNSPTNIIGTTKLIGVRDIPVPTGDVAYVRKFGTDYLISEITDIQDPISVNMEFKIYSSVTNVLLGSRVGGAAFIAGASLADPEGCYMDIVADGGAVTVLASITIDTDIDAGGLAFVCTAESIADGDTLRLYLSDTTSTYYDSEYMYGGARHVPILNDARLPYYTINAGISACTTANDDGVEVLDSATYEFQSSISLSQLKVYSTDGQNPTITKGVGARLSRDISHDGNNVDTIYVSKTGSDSNTGTYQSPFLTLQYAENNMSGLTYLNIMDSGVYTETIAISSNITIESIYGKIPIISAPSANDIITITSVGVSIKGVCINGNSIGLKAIHINIGAVFTGSINDCDIYDSQSGIITNGLSGNAYDGNILRNKIHDISVNQGIYLAPAVDSAGLIEGNIIYNVTDEGMKIEVLGGLADIDIIDNLCYNTSSGIRILESAAPSAEYVGICENNTLVYNNEYGLEISGTTGGTFSNMICWGNTVFDLFAFLSSGSISISYSNYGTNDGWTIGTGNITTDPQFMQITAPYNFALKIGSGAYKTDSNTDDMGSHFRLIEFNESTIEINGFIIDGQDQYNNAVFILDGVDHITNSLKWCNVFDFQGIAIDPYDDSTDTFFTVLNCKIYNNGNGIKLTRGSNAIQRCLIYSNIIYGVHSDYASQTFTNNVFFGNIYGLYLKNNSSNIVYKDNISLLNSVFGIFSEALIVLSTTYCCITDGASNMNISDPSNIEDNPLFINTNVGSEDFNIKTVELGFKFNSPCRGISSTGGDIGAYVVDRDVLENYWRKYTLQYNPSSATYGTMDKGLVKFNDGAGSLHLWTAAFKRFYKFKYGNNSASSEILKAKLEYFSTLITAGDNSEIVESMTKFLLTFVTSESLLSSSGTTYPNVQDTKNETKVLADATLDLTENLYKGFWVDVIFNTDTFIIDKLTKTMTVTGGAYTVDALKGFTIFYNGYPYYIKSNTADVFTISDPEETLVDSTEILNITKSFRILVNSKNAFILSDINDELPDGTYSYKINYIETVIQKPGLTANQRQFQYTQKVSITGYSLTMEES
jgi:hypothetical protein